MNKYLHQEGHLAPRRRKKNVITPSIGVNDAVMRNRRRKVMAFMIGETG
jgi:hypothetical protein